MAKMCCRSHLDYMRKSGHQIQCIHWMLQQMYQCVLCTYKHKNFNRAYDQHCISI